VSDERAASDPATSTVYRVVHVVDVAFDFAAATATVHLREAEGQRRFLRLPVALHDATALFHAWRRIAGRRPATSELMTSLLQELRADVIATRVVRHDAGIFFGELDVMTTSGRRVFDCRPSDAITLALRQSVPAPLLVADEILASGSGVAP
jgi:hypothetical protein